MTSPLLLAQAIDVDKILGDYMINPVNADLLYNRRDLKVRGTVADITNGESQAGTAVGQAEMTSQSGTHWFCNFNSEQLLDIAQLRRGDHVVLGGLLQMRIVRDRLKKTNEPLTFERCSLISRETPESQSSNPAGSNKPAIESQSNKTVATGTITSRGPLMNSAPKSDTRPMVDGSPSVADSEVYKIGGDATPPVLLHQVEATFTEQALKAKLQGTVKLSMVIDQRGIPTRIQVLEGLGLGLEQQAILAQQQSRFRPAIRDGKPVSFYLTNQTTFSCEGCSGDLDPVFKTALEPQYPESASKFNIWESATFSINRLGTPDNILTKEYRAIDWNEHPGRDSFFFDLIRLTPLVPAQPDIHQNTLEAVKQWTFQPAFRGGIAVNSSELKIYFHVLWMGLVDAHVGTVIRVEGPTADLGSIVPYRLGAN